MGGGTAPIFWEREPFIWEDDDRRVTRFVSLGAFGGTLPIDKKQRVRVGYMNYTAFISSSCSGSMLSAYHQNSQRTPYSLRTYP